MVVFDWDIHRMDVPTPGGVALFHEAHLQRKILNAANMTSMELNFYRNLGFSERGARGALAVDWNAKNLRGTGSYGRDWNMHRPRALLQGGIPKDQIVLHNRIFHPGWLPRRMPRQQYLARKMVARVLPGVGWALLAYDAYDLLVNQSIWGFKVV